jgi:hypothetical protein
VGRAGTGLWVAWGLAFVGGVAVLAAAVLVLSDPCTEAGSRLATSACAGSPSPLASTLALGGTAVAVLGGLTATLLTVRRWSRRSGDVTDAADATG